MYFSFFSIHLADTQAHIASISSATEEEWHDKNIKDIDFNYIILYFYHAILLLLLMILMQYEPEYQQDVF
jgi:hypothetical protein